MSEGMKQIIEFATADGKAQGTRIRNREITIRLSEKGYSADEIAELIGLDLQTVQHILADC